MRKVTGLPKILVLIRFVDLDIIEFSSGFIYIYIHTYRICIKCIGYETITQVCFGDSLIQYIMNIILETRYYSHTCSLLDW